MEDVLLLSLLPRMKGLEGSPRRRESDRAHGRAQRGARAVKRATAYRGVTKRAGTAQTDALSELPLAAVSFDVCLAPQP